MWYSLKEVSWYWEIENNFNERKQSQNISLESSVWKYDWWILYPVNLSKLCQAYNLFGNTNETIQPTVRWVKKRKKERNHGPMMCTEQWIHLNVRLWLDNLGITVVEQSINVTDARR